MTYPSSPGHVAGSECSKAAAEAIAPRAGTLRQMAYDFILSQGQKGANSYEVQLALGLPHQTASARCSELRAKGRVVRTTDKRPTATQRSYGAVLIADVVAEQLQEAG